MEANVLFALNLLELFVHWRLGHDEFRGCVLPEAWGDVMLLCRVVKLAQVPRCQVQLFADSSVDVNSWVSQSGLQIRYTPEVASFSALLAVAPGSGGHLCVELRQEACPDGSGSGVIVKLSGNTYPLVSLFNDWKGEGAGSTYVRTSRAYRDPAELTDLAQRLMPLQSVNVKTIIGFGKYPALEAALQKLDGTPVRATPAP